MAISPSGDLPETHQLIGLAKRGVDMTILHGADAPNVALIEASGVPHKVLELNSRWDKKATRFIRQEILDTDPDIIHMFTNRAVQNGLRASRGLRPRLLAYRGIAGVEKVHDPISWLTFLNPRIDKIICVADAIRQHLVSLKLPGWRFPPDKAITIHKGHDVDWYQKPAVARSSLGVPEEAIVLVCTVNDRPRKGLPYLIDACHQMAELENLHVLLVGNIDKNNYTETLARCAMSDRIHFTGYRKDVTQVIAAADICILAATKREGLPRGIIEGMVNEVTPTVADAGGSPELIEHGVSGMIFAPADASAIADTIRYLVTHPEECQAMGKVARERIKRDFNYLTTIDKTFEVYQELAAKA
ncbi:MAG: glycosyltransferase family 4 protein [Gammaproteobacteria bacterium]